MTVSHELRRLATTIIGRKLNNNPNRDEAIILLMCAEERIGNLTPRDSKVRLPRL